MIDVLVIGAGVCGAAISRELSKYLELSIVCVDKDTDVANGTSKANSGIVHAGYDPAPGSLMAKYNVKGNEMIRSLVKQLDIPFRQTGSLVLSFSDEEQKTLEELYQRGLVNGVPELSLLSADEVKKMEPNLSDRVNGALYAKTAGVISPWELATAQFDVAVQNGVKLLLNTEVTEICQKPDCFEVTVIRNGKTEALKAKYIVNAAGVHSDRICGMVSTPTFSIVPNKGQYYLLDKSQGSLVSSVIFQCPTKAGKGVLVSPTAHGNLIVGPDAVDIEDPEDVSTTAEQLEYIRTVAAKSCDRINYRESIRNFAGVRAQGCVDEFVIGAIPESERFINVANIKSPGLTSSPAIALDVVAMLQKSGLSLKEKSEYVKTRKVIRFRELSAEEKKEMIQKDPRYGRIICRCETVTEGEIVAAIHAPVPATTVDAVKRRCNAGMGRCQGGFCSPRVVEIISRELEISPEQVLKDKTDSWILFGMTSKGSVK